MKPICELGERHGVNLGQGYKNNQACTIYFYRIHSKNLLKLYLMLYFSVFRLMAVQTLVILRMSFFIAVYLNHNAIDKQVHIRNPFFTVRRLEHGDAQGL